MIARAAAVAHLDRPATSAEIAQPGRNCWRVERAHRFQCVQDAAEYFRLIHQALLSARRTVFILGWDITAHTDLLPGAGTLDVPTRFDKLVVQVVRRRPELRCYILTWDYGALYTLERDPLTRWRLGWRMPRRVRFGFDDHHPVGGCHHQKVVVVDDQLAFCGGIDLTSHRWDTSAHRVEEPARMTPLGKAYGPYHEVQAMVSGPVAASLGELARDRWKVLGADRLPPLGPSSDDLWPADVTPDLRDVDVGIARTMPGSDDQPAVRECEALFVDSIALARRTIYIESQYFTNHKIGRALASRLSEPNGPEVVIVAPKECEGWLERHTMGAFRDSVFKELVAADTHKRLRLVYPAASRSGDVPTFVHSKVMVVDDVLVRIGSANCSHRSMGVDTECDLAVDACGDRDAREGIRRIRDRLLAEHLGLPADDVTRGIERAGSAVALIDERAGADRTLVPIHPVTESGDAPPAAIQAAADPDEPIGVSAEVDSLVPTADASGGRDPLRIWILPVMAIVVAAGVAWTPLFRDVVAGTSGRPWPAALGVVVFLIAGLLLVPLELLAIAAGVLLGTSRGSLVALVGSIAAAVMGYVAGRWIGRARIAHWTSRRSYRSLRQLGGRGAIGVAVLRLSGIASAGSIHLLCGAGRVPLGHFMAGTLVALVPTVAALSALGGQFRQAVLSPSIWNTLVAVGGALLIVAVAAALRTALLIRQFASSVSSHRDRAEFG